MNVKSTRKSKHRMFNPLVLVNVALIGTLAVGDVQAAGIPVIDVPHTIKTALGWIAQYQQMINNYRQEIEQLQTLNKQYEQALVNGDTFDGEPGYREKFEQRLLNDGVEESCGSEPKNNPVGPQQYDYCVAIVRTENRRFNAMVRMLEDVEERDRQLKEAVEERRRIGKDEQGKLESNTNRILSLQSQLQNDVQNSATLMDAYEAALTSLREDQIRTANTALKSQSTLLGNATQGAALKLALRAARARER